MSRVIRSLLVGWLLAAYAAVAACGPGLHVLPGFDHTEHGPSDGSADDPRSHDDCPICHFSAQGQLPAAPLDWVEPGPVRPHANARPIRLTSTERLEPPSLRGPPPAA